MLRCFIVLLINSQKLSMTILIPFHFSSHDTLTSLPPNSPPAEQRASFPVKPTEHKITETHNNTQKMAYLKDLSRHSFSPESLPFLKQFRMTKKKIKNKVFSMYIFHSPMSPFPSLSPPSLPFPPFPGNHRHLALVDQITREEETEGMEERKEVGKGGQEHKEKGEDIPSEYRSISQQSSKRNTHSTLRCPKTISLKSTSHCSSFFASSLIPYSSQVKNATASSLSISLLYACVFSRIAHATIAARVHLDIYQGAVPFHSLLTFCECIHAWFEKKGKASKLMH